MPVTINRTPTQPLAPLPSSVRLKATDGDLNELWHTVNESKKASITVSREALRRILDDYHSLVGMREKAGVNVYTPI